MASRDAKVQPVRTQQIKTSWLKNAMSSIGSSSRQVLGEYAPTISGAISSGADLAKSMKTSVRGTRRGSIGTNLNQNKYVKIANTAFKNALDDIKTGHIAGNKDRALQSQMGENGFDDLFSEGTSGVTFGDDGNTNVTMNYVNAAGSAEAFTSLSSSINKQTELTLQTSKAQTDAYVSMSSAQFFQAQQIGGQVLEHLGAINQNLASLVEYNSTNMNKFIESSIAYYDKMGQHMASNDKSSDKKNDDGDINNVIGADGKFNFSAYKKYAMKRLKDNLSNTQFGMVAEFMDENALGMIASDPIGFLSSAVIQYAVPEVLSTTIKGMDSAIEGMLPSLMKKLYDWGDKQSGSISGTIMGTLAKSFGLNLERDKYIDKKQDIELNVDAIPFDGETKLAITNTITKELGEQTVYLKYIAERMGGSGKKDIARNASELSKRSKDRQIFNFDTKRYNSINDLDTSLLEGIEKSITKGFSNTDFGKYLNAAINQQEDESTKKQLRDMQKQLYYVLERDSADTSLSYVSKDGKISSDMAKALKSLTGTKKNINVFEKILGQMASEDPFAFNTLVQGQIRANQNRKRKLREYTENPTRSGILQTDLFDQVDENGEPIGIDDQMLKYYRRISGGNLNRKSKVGAVDLRSAVDNDLFANGDTMKFMDLLKQKAGTRISGIGNAFMNNDSQALTREVGAMFSDAASTAMTAMNDKFFTPMKNKIFGEKDENGFSKNGMISGMENVFHDSFLEMQHKLTGKAYVDSKGEKHAASEDSVTATIKAGVMEKIFGPEEVDENGNRVRRSRTGLFSTITDGIKSSFANWHNAIFGDFAKDGTKVDKDTVVKVMEDSLKDKLPNAMLGGVAGGAAGLASGGLLGALIGGPIGGVVIGSAVGMASKSEKFQKLVFGDDNKDNGLISKGVQKYFKENKNALIGGATIGGIKGAITGGGFLGTLVGGPVAGAILGMATTTALKSKAFNDFLFGNEEKGQIGIINSFKNVLGKKRGNKDEAGLSLSGKTLGMGISGAAAGALTMSLLSKVGFMPAMLTAGGPVGGAMIGLGLAIKAQSDTFSRWLFGNKKDKNSPEYKAGVIGQFGNALQVYILQPFKHTTEEIARDIGITFKYNILGTIENAIEPIGNAVADMAYGIKKKATGILNFIGSTIANKVADPIVGFLTTTVLKPFKTLGTNVAKLTYNLGKQMVLLPFRIVGGITHVIMSPVRKAVSYLNPIKFGKFLMHTIATGFEKATGLSLDPIRNMAQTAADWGKKKILDILKSPFKLVGGIVNGAASVVGGVANAIEDVDERANIRRMERGGLFDNETMKKRYLKEQEKNGGKVTDENGNELSYNDWKNNYIKSKNKRGYNYIERLKETYERERRKGKIELKEDGTVPTFDEWKEDYMKKDFRGRYKVQKRNENAERAEAKVEKKRNRDTEKNQQQILKYTGYSQWEDTVANRATAEARAGKKLKWRGEASDANKIDETASLTDDELARADTKKMSNSARQVSLLQKILNVIEGKNPDGSDKKTGLFGNEIEVKDFDSGENDESKQHSILGEMFNEETGELNEEYSSKLGELSADADTASMLHGIFSRLTGRGYKKGTNNAKEGYSLVGEAGRPEIVWTNGGDRVYSDAQKPIRVEIASISSTVVKQMEEADAKQASGSESSSNVSSTRMAADAYSQIDAGEQAENNATVDNGGGMMGLPLAIMNGNNSAEGSQTDVQLPSAVGDNQMSVVKAKQELRDKAMDSALTADEAMAAKEENRRQSRFDKMLAGIEAISNTAHATAEKTTDFFKGWGDIFGKKGLVTAGLVALLAALNKSGLLQKLLELLGKGLSGAAGAIGSVAGAALDALGDAVEGATEDAEFHKKHNATTNGKGSEKEKEEAQNDVDELMNGDILGYLTNDEGHADHRTTSKASLLRVMLREGGAVVNAIIEDGPKGLVNLFSRGKNYVDPATGKASTYHAHYKNSWQDKLINKSEEAFKKYKEAWDKGTERRAARNTVDNSADNVVDDALKELDKEATDATVQEGTEKAAKEGTEATVEKGAKEGTEATAKKGAKEGTEATVEKGTKEITEESLEQSAKKGAKEGTENALEKGAKETTEATVEKASKETAEATVSASVEKGAKEGTEEALEAGAAKVTKESAEDAQKTLQQKILKKTTELVKSGFNKLIGMIESKMGKSVGDTAVGKAMSVVSKAFKNSKIVQLIVDRVGPLIGMSAAAAGTVVGYVAKEGVGIALGALDGLTGTARLFYIDKSKVDGTMRTIATVMRALAGTDKGTLLDVVNEIIAAAYGVDLFNVFAVWVYKTIANLRGREDLKDDLDTARSDFKEDYVNYQQSTIAKQYYDLVNSGVEGIKEKYGTVVDYIQAVKSGEASAEYDSFQDYNSKQNGGVVEKGTNATVEGAVSFDKKRRDLEDKSTTYGYGDAAGNRYYMNDDGTYTVKDSKGKVLSNHVSADTVEGTFKYGVEHKHTGEIKQVEERLQLKPGQTYNTKTDEETIIPFKNGKEVYWEDSSNGTYFVKKGSTYDMYNRDGTVVGIGFSKEHVDNLKYKAQYGYTKEEQQEALKNKYFKTTDQQNKELKETTDAYLKDFKSGGKTHAVSDLKSKREKDDATVKDMLTIKDETSSKKSLIDDYKDGTLEKKTKDNKNIAKDEQKAADEIEKQITAYVNKGNKLTTAQMNKIVNNVMSKYETSISESNVMRALANAYADKVKSEEDEKTKEIVKNNKSTKKRFYSKDDSKEDKTKQTSSKKSTNKNKKTDTDATQDTTPTKKKKTKYKDTDASVESVIKTYMSSGKKSWTDGNGLTYKPTGDGTYDVYNNNGDIIGTGITGDVVATKARQNEVTSGTDTTKNKKKLNSTNKKRKSLFSQIVSVFTAGNEAQAKVNDDAKADIEKHASEISKSGTTEDNSGKIPTLASGKVLFAADLSYYEKTGSTWDRYNALGDKVKTGITDAEIQIKLKANMLHEGDKPKSTVADDTIKSGTTSMSNAWTTAKNSMTSLWNDYSNNISKSQQQASSSLKTGSATSTSKRGGSGVGSKRRRLFGGGFGSRKAYTPDTMNGHSYYAQTDTRWSGTSYDYDGDGGTIGDSGCGPAAMSMAISDATGSNVDPTTLASFAQSTGTRDNTGTNWNFVNDAANAYGLSTHQEYNPNRSFLEGSLRNGHDVVLSGTSSGGSTPYTSAGHYVVAVGQDKNGRIKVNDPRGKAYSRSYKPEDLLRYTGSAWAIGDGGYGRRSSRRRGGFGPTDASSSADMLNGFPYLLQQDSRWGDKQYSSIGDSSQTIASSACGPTSMAIILRSFGVDITPVETCQYALDNGMRTANSGTSWEFFDSIGKKYGLTTEELGVSKDGIVNSLSNAKPVIGSMGPGTFTQGGHFIDLVGIKDNKIIVNDCASRDRSMVTYDPSVFVNEGNNFWAFSKNGKGSINNVAALGSIAGQNTNSNTNATVSDGNATDKIGSFFSEVGNRALEGVLTGKWNTDFTSFWNPSTGMTSTDTSTSTTTTASSGSLTGNSNTEKIFNYLTTTGGMTPAGAAGLMGNLESESGMEPNNVQNSCEARVGTDSVYTAGVDSGTISRASFISDDAGYGLAQWTSDGRKAGLYDLVKSRNVSIGDLQTQLDWLMTEMKSPSYSAVYSVLTSTTDVQAASDAVLHKFESPKDQSGAVEAKRGSQAQKWYNMYANKTGGTGGGFGIQMLRALNKLTGGRGMNKILNRLKGGKGGTAADAREALVNWMLCLVGRNTYTNEPIRERVMEGVDGHGFGDCSSTCCKVYETALGMIIGTYTGDMIGNGTVVDGPNGQMGTYPDESKMLPGDLVFYYSSGASGKDGHVEMYIGNGTLCGHGGGSAPGPRIHGMKEYQDGRISSGHGTWIQVVRYVKDGETYNVNPPDKSKLKVPNTYTDGKGNSANGANTGSSTTTSSTDATTTTSTSGGQEGNTTIDKIGNFFTEVGNRALDGTLTGNWNTDFNSFWNGTTTTTTTGAATTSTGGAINGNFNKYSLNDSQRKYIAQILMRETSGETLDIAKDAASHLVNLNEVDKGNPATGEGLMTTLTTGWYGAGGGSIPDYAQNPNQNCYDAITDVIENGHRTVPRYVTEYDMFPEDASISGHWHNGKSEDGSQYVKHVTLVSQAPKGEVRPDWGFTNPAKYTFYKFMGNDSQNGDIMGYYESYYQKYKEDDPRPDNVTPEPGGSGVGARRKNHYLSNPTVINKIARIGGQGGDGESTKTIRKQSKTEIDKRMRERAAMREKRSGAFQDYIDKVNKRNGGHGVVQTNSTGIINASNSSYGSTEYTSVSTLSEIMSRADNARGKGEDSELLRCMIEILAIIADNTGKGVNGLSQANDLLANLKSGGTNLIVNKGGDTPVASSLKQEGSKPTKNMKLAQQIAAGK